MDLSNLLILPQNSISLGLSSFQAKFIQCFVDDNRYQYLLKGLGSTLLITLFAVLLGVILGFLWPLSGPPMIKQES